LTSNAIPTAIIRIPAAILILTSLYPLVRLLTIPSVRRNRYGETYPSSLPNHWLTAETSIGCDMTLDYHIVIPKSAGWTSVVSEQFSLLAS
jgi:hypothetical protein